jgi:phosphohistidine phosphatase
MPHRLVLVRHARAAPSAGPDLLRPLTDEGERQARRQGERLGELAAAAGFGELGPVLCSPAARCIQTASGLLEGLGRDESPDVRSDLAESSPVRLMLGLALESAPGSILVGHQPSLADLACSLLGSTSLPVALAPSTALLLKRPEAGVAWSLAGVLPPP